MVKHFGEKVPEQSNVGCVIGNAPPGKGTQLVFKLLKLNFLRTYMKTYVD